MDRFKIGDKVAVASTTPETQGTVTKFFKNGTVSVEVGTEKKHKKLHVSPDVLRLVETTLETPAQ